MIIDSASYSDNTNMPVKYARVLVSGGKNISPQFHWMDIPDGTKSFVLAMIDHYPIASNWVHWIVINIPANCNMIQEGVSNTSKMPWKSIELINTFGTKGYGGPQPPVGSGRHYYDTTIYALNIDKLQLTGRVSESELLTNIRQHILDKAVSRGLFGR